VIEGGNRDGMNEEVVFRDLQDSLRHNVEDTSGDGSGFNDEFDGDLWHWRPF
jgi:hypothetical protein